MMGMTLGTAKSSDKSLKNELGLTGIEEQDLQMCVWSSSKEFYGIVHELFWLLQKFTYRTCGK